VTLGAAIGSLAAIAATRLLGTLLYGVRPEDPGTFLSVAGLLTTVGAAACLLPARRAARIEPMEALRQE
jgi:putative ABC transport system permease protein